MKKQDQAAKLKNQSSALSLSFSPPIRLPLSVSLLPLHLHPSLVVSCYIYTHFFFHLTVPVLITPGPKRTEVSDKSVLLRWKPRSCSLQLSVPLSLSECRGGGGGVTQRSELPYYVLHIKIQHLIVTSTIYLRANVRVVPAALCL